MLFLKNLGWSLWDWLLIAFALRDASNSFLRSTSVCCPLHFIGGEILRPYMLFSSAMSTSGHGLFFVKRLLKFLFASFPISVDPIFGFILSGKLLRTEIYYLESIQIKTLLGQEHIWQTSVSTFTIISDLNCLRQVKKHSLDGSL